MDIHSAVVIGTGLSGRAAAKLLHSFGIQVRVLEKNENHVPADFSAWAKNSGIEILCGEHKPEYFLNADVVIPSPAAAKASIEPLLPSENPPAIMSETEFAWHYLNGEKVISITGTSGKTTTTSLVAAMIEQQRMSVFTGGNIGTPLSEYILARNEGQKPVDVVVLELSSFQLQTCTAFRPDVGIILNISENHLDFHKDMDEYISAKMNMFVRQSRKDTAVVASPLLHFVQDFGLKARIIEFNPSSSRFTNMKLFGAHNRANAEAAYLAAHEIGVSEETAMQAVAAFEPIPNRLERVEEKNGILFVNDSKATTVEALSVALNAFDRPVLLLAGGKFKGGDLTGIAPLVKKKVRHVALFGASREYFEQAWRDVVPITWDETLEKAMIRLAGTNGLAQKDDVVLLAPATSSFDQYQSYIHRGKDFKRIVKDIL